MALINCPECRKPVSETAATCPSCGFGLSPEVVATQKAKQQTEGTIIGVGCLGVLILFVVMCSGVLTGGGNSFTSTTSSPYDYNDSTDSHLKILPNMRSYSDRDKEQIIRAAKELDARVRALEKQRGF
jgi:hypothetical protein